MSREIVLDTETTGLDPKHSGIIEIAAIELMNRIPTGDYFHCFIQPKRAVEKGAFAIHGISDAFLEDKPVFAEIVDDFLAYIDKDPLVIHNAPFDIGMLNEELRRIDYPLLTGHPVEDTLKIAKLQLPGQMHSLDALCLYYKIDLSARSKHSALIDVKLLAEVYARLKGVQQEFSLENENAASSQLKLEKSSGNRIIQTASIEEEKAHKEFMDMYFSNKSLS